MKKTLILLRGLPGSGKSTLALQFKDAPVISADDFFMVNGNYIFDKEKLGMAHAYSQDKVEYLMMENTPVIVVANTFTTEKELKPYTELAELYEYQVFSLIVENRHGNTSVHNVPEETMKRMKDRFSIKL